MSSAQALASGILGSAPSARPSNSSAGVERRDSAFRDTLDEASRSREAPEADSRSDRADRARSGDDANKERDGEDRRDEGSAGERDRFENARGDNSAASNLSAILARLGGGQATDAGSEFTAAEVQPDEAATLPALVGEDEGPMLPSEDGGETLDAEKLMLLLKSGVPKSASDVDKVDIKVTVAAQETHLALTTAEPDEAALLAPMANADADVVDGAETVQGGVKAAAAGLSQGADEIKKVAGNNGQSRADAAADSKEASRGKPVGEQWAARSGAALSEHDVAGGDARQSDGRGSSGGNSQQQGSNAFMSLLASVSSQAANAVRNAAGVDYGADPVMDQIAAGVRAELKADGLIETSSEGVVKVLSIELKPANLGAVTVRIALKDNAVTVHIQAQKNETLAVIERERDALEAALKTAGYSVDGISAAPQGEASRSLGVSPTGGDTQAMASGASSSAGQSGQGLGDSQGQQGRSGHSDPGRAQAGTARDGKDTQAEGVRSGGNGLYV